jgi:subtilisin family serine protease
MLAAPAVDIMSTESRLVTASGYAARTGTSDATAIIAGVAALVRSEFPELSAEEVIHRMTYTADDRGAPGRDDQYGYGIVNPVAALTADVPLLNPPGDGAGGPTPGGGGISTRTLVVVAGILVASWFVVLVVGGLVLASRR